VFASPCDVERVGALGSLCDGRFRRRRHAQPTPSAIVGDERARVRLSWGKPVAVVRDEVRIAPVPSDSPEEPPSVSSGSPEQLPCSTCG
jgi:hypothetical protein